MRSTFLALLAIFTLLPLASPGQLSTNLPATAIENFELQPDTVIVKGFGEIGSIATDTGVISVRCKESQNALTGTRMYGIAVAFTSNSSRGYLVVDYDELDPLIRSLNYLGGISYNVTTMPSFDASVTTRSGLRISAHSERKQGGIQMFLQFDDSWKIPLTSDQFQQLQSLISQAKTDLDGMRKNSV